MVKSRVLAAMILLLLLGAAGWWALDRAMPVPAATVIRSRLRPESRVEASPGPAEAVAAPEPAETPAFEQPPVALPVAVVSAVSSEELSPAALFAERVRNSSLSDWESRYLVLQPDQAEATQTLEDRYAELARRTWRDPNAVHGDGSDGLRRIQIAKAFLAELRPLLDPDQLREYLSIGNYGEGLRMSALGAANNHRALADGEMTVDDILHSNAFLNPVSSISEDFRQAILAQPAILKSAISTMTLNTLADERLLRIQQHRNITGVDANGRETVYRLSLGFAAGTRSHILRDEGSRLELSLATSTLPRIIQSYRTMPSVLSLGFGFMPGDIPAFWDTPMWYFFRTLGATGDLAAAAP